MQRRTYQLATGTIAVVGAVGVWTIATQVFPYHSLNHDEAVYLQQAGMLLEGQLSLRPPVEDVFRPWFFVEDGDRLYPKYAPVPAAMFALGRVLGGYRLALLAIAAANLVLVVAVVDEVFDRPTGLLAGGFVLASPLFLVDSAVFLPYAPTTLLNLLFAYGYLRADRTDDRRWAAVAGTSVGLAFFSRPYTAVLFAIPFVGHALYTLATDGREPLQRQALTAALGLAGVGTALGYNAVVTGSPWLFPYEAFAPLDGLGFGHRAILGHDTRYTPELALRANTRVVELFYTEWIAGGILGAALAVVGIARTVRDGLSPREGVIAGLFVSIVAGNVYFWGNLNILGDIDRAGDGLVSSFGPYYHFDLLLPTAAFGATGALWGARVLYRRLDGRLARRQVRVTMVLVVLVSGGILGTVTASELDERIGENMVATTTYEDVYEPFEDGPPKRSLVFLPHPYGHWLNHPFQPLRNSPGFDGRAVYAIDEHPFEVVEAFPDRRLYRYVYRGAWAPYAGSPEAARLQRIRDVSGSRVRLRTTVGIPNGTVGVTARLTANNRSIYFATDNASGSLDVDLVISDGRVRVAGDVRPLANDTLAVAGRGVVRMTVFVDYGPGGGFTYRFDLPVNSSDGHVRALSPRIEHCQNARACGGEAAYIPASVPDGIFVRAELIAREPNS